MKRISYLAAAVVLASCSGPSTKTEVDHFAGSGNPTVKIYNSENMSARKPSSAPEAYIGQPGNFSYKYDGKWSQFSEALISHRAGVPTGVTPDFTFMTKMSGERMALLKQNLFDTGVDVGGIDCAKVMSTLHRTPTGNCYYHGVRNEKYEARTGNNQQRFGRNSSPEVSNAAARFGVMEPNPREISLKLFSRKDGKTREADIINVLAAAWLQAENHDWFTHGKNAKAHEARPLQVPKVEGDKEFPNGQVIPATKVDNSSAPKHGYAKTFRNDVTHWWDASHIYGSNEETIRKVRTNPENGQLLPGGKIAVHPDRHLYYDAEGLPITGFNDNWWVGLELIHTLFAMEHNVVVEKLKEQHPTYDDETLFQKGRLIVAALIAKIHTVEWTPALLDNKVLHIGMYSNWYGIKSVAGVNNVFLRNILGKLSPNARHAVSGLVGTSLVATYNVPFTLTEEFVSVYRMHTLIPETVQPRRLDGSPVSGPVKVEDTIFRKANGLMSGAEGSLNWMYGLGTGHPGGLVLNNHPTFMQRITAERNIGHTSGPENSVRMDLGAIDILRDRERNVPRYNDFRRALRLKPLTKFEDLTDDKEEVRVLKEVYGSAPADVEKLDLLVGTLAEKDRYAGYAFGNTPFYIFALMASRRLMADPFYSEHFKPEVYTKLGYDWVQNQTMIDVITRHFPELKPHFQGVNNAFKPWQPVYEKVKKKYSAAAVK